MKIIKYLDIYIDDGCSWGTLRGRYSNVDILMEKVSQSEHLRSKLNNQYWHKFDSKETSIKLFGDNSIVKLEIIKETDSAIGMISWVENGYVEIYESIVTPEVKEEGVPYQPEKITKKLKEKIPFGKDICSRTILVEKREFKLDGIPIEYGDMK